MQRSGAATRRFYAAFYHWTLRSSNPTRRCAGTTSTLVTRRKRSTTHGVSVPSRRHSEPVWTSEQLRKEAVQSTADRPTDSLDLWEHAVREKSEKSVTVELLVPQRVLHVKDVANRARIHEVKLSTPGLREDAGDDEPCAVVLEGGYTDVKAVWKNLYTHGAGQSSNGSTAAKQATHADVEPIAHRLRQDFAREQQQSLVEKECSLPESFWQPIGKEGTIEYLSAQFGLHADMLDQSGPLQYARLKGSERQIREVDLFLDNVRAWELERTHVKNSIGKAAVKQVKIIRRNDLPSESLEVWQSVTRKQLQGNIEIDICLPERVWQQVIRNGGAENLHARFATEFEPLEVLRDGKTRCVSLKGDVEHVDRAKGYLKGFRVNVPDLRKDKEYLKIHRAATGLHTINNAKQQQSARRNQEKTGSNKRTAQAPSEKAHKSSATSSPEKQPSSENTVLDKAAEAEQQTSPVLIAKVAESGDQPPASNVQKLDTPEAGQADKPFAWLKIANTIDNREGLLKIKAISDKHGCFISRYKRVADEEGFLKVFGPKEGVTNVINDLQQVCDEGRKNHGRPALKAEIVYMGSRDEMPDFNAAKQSILSGTPAIGKDQASESTEQPALPRLKATRVERSHFASLKISQNRSNVFRVRDILDKTTAKFGCKLSKPVVVGKTEGEIQGVARLLGSEETVKSAVKALQQQLANDIQDRSGKPAGTVEIIQIGLKKDMGAFDAFVQLHKKGAPAISAKQPISSPQQIPVENGAAKHAEKVSSSSTSSETHQHSTVDKATAPEASEAAEQAAKQSNQQLSDDMRSALRHITQPVALVTSSLPKKRNQTGDEIRRSARGVTVSSFCTVTLQPIPVVSFNIRVPSRSWDAISASGYLRVHLLKASPEGAAVAHAFTLPYEQPHQPFEQLSQSSVTTAFFRKTQDPAKVPQLTSRAAIHANFVARLIPEKCIQVGDHMIVVAEVTETHLTPFAAAAASDTGALSYGMRGYRQLGGEIKPSELKLAEPQPSNVPLAKEVKSAETIPDNGVKTTNREFVADHVKPDEEAPNKTESVLNAVNEIAEPTEQESDHLPPGENAPDDIATSDMADLYERFSADSDEEHFEAAPAPAPKNIEDLGPSSPMLDEESLRQVLEENEAAYISSGLPSQTAADNPALAEALNAVAGAYNDASEPAVSTQPELTSQTPGPLADQPTDPAAAPQSEPAPQAEAPSDANPAKSATREERPANALSAGKRPWGMDGSMTQQIRKMSIFHTSPPRRHHSTNNSDSDSDPPDHPPLSKRILQTTVEDYLCQIPSHRKRYKTLIKLQRSAETFEAQLHRTQASITEEEAASLSTKAQIARRKVSRELALRNAQDLRAMLDKGRVAAGAAQWLESNLEQGQVVLLEEAKVLRRELEDGRSRVKDFEKAKAELTGDYEAIDAQLMRLRDLAEDDVEELDDGEFGKGGGRGVEGDGDGRVRGRG
ncbi:hypothetical protein MBLNU13_g03665t1 [Cladosporium sp. NU13]